MKLLLYCTKAKPYLYKENQFGSDWYFTDSRNCIVNEYHFNTLNGKIVAECDFEIEEIKRINTIGDWFYYENQDEILEKSCIVDITKFFEYLQGKNGYAIHIKNLNIFDEPSEINSYYQLDEKALKENEYEVKAITKAPQNMMYCEDGLETKVLISIRPEWLCKILNGEKTIEVRKKVLKEMLNDNK